MVDLYSRVYLVRKGGIMPFARKWMELELFMLSRISQMQLINCHTFSHTFFLEART